MGRIPDDKRYFRIGEASRIIGVEPYVLRFWEGEFSQVRPKRADSNQRTYRREDLETLLDIKRLLYDERMTIEGAKHRLKKQTAEETPIDVSFVENIKAELNEILKMLA
ncbi:MAG: MerR family transcriptional regulator [Deltaproteobacteria bacterium]|nr:MerR family transcriptional regulator [Deltaproteobacteria bacterium]MBW2118682.1 MerR family transcriptional regulator [Deltaproteobacteria bacterium]MBW2343314.1 MerR family transcriptional regulator [Deltaproteobacteria bacterium]